MKILRTPQRLPQNYAGLCRVHLPRPIHSREEYKNVVNIAESLALIGDDLNRDQADYYEMLCSIIEDFENVPPPNLSPLSLLKQLLQEHQMTGADLAESIGLSRTMGPKILSGERSITAHHAGLLGARFGVSPAVFIAPIGQKPAVRAIALRAHYVDGHIKKDASVRSKVKS